MKKMPPDVMRIAIVREPLSYLQSAFKHYNFYKALNLPVEESSIYHYLKNVKRYSQKKVEAYLFNRVSREFAYDPKSDIKSYMAKISSRFLVLIVQLFDESLVILKRSLGWSLKDILYLPQRVGSYDHSKSLNQSLANLYSKLSPYDYEFYEYFRKEMERKITTQDNDFRGEVTLFKSMTQITRTFCEDICSNLNLQTVDNQKRNHSALKGILEQTIVFPTSRWDTSIPVWGYDCLMMKFNVDVLRAAQQVHQWPEMCQDGNYTDEGRWRRPQFDVKRREMYCNQNYFHHTYPWGILDYTTHTFLSKCF